MRIESNLRGEKRGKKESTWQEERKRNEERESKVTRRTRDKEE